MDNAAITPVLVALILVAAAFFLALSFRLVLSAPPRPRALAFAGYCLVLFTLPWLCSSTPVTLKIFVVLACCAALPPKLANAALHPGYWMERPISKWFAHLLNPFILVPHLHDDVPIDPANGRRLAIRGLVKMTLGATLLVLAFRYIDGRSAIPFWLEHAIKLAGAYLLVFDGGFTLARGVLQVIGARVLDLSRNPALSATPAEFWRRYNCEAGRFLRENVFYPLGGRRHPALATLVTFLINGVLHEYLSVLMVGQVVGLQLLFFSLHGVATAATLRWRPRGWARHAATTGTVLFLYASSVLFFMNINMFLPWYSGR